MANRPNTGVVFLLGFFFFFKETTIFYQQGRKSNQEQVRFEISKLEAVFVASLQKAISHARKTRQLR